MEGTIKTLESKLTIKELKIDNLNTKIEGLELTNKQSKDESENTIKNLKYLLQNKDDITQNISNDHALEIEQI